MAIGYFCWVAFPVPCLLSSALAMEELHLETKPPILIDKQNIKAISEWDPQAGYSGRMMTGIL